jgi:hypothetical protein
MIERLYIQILANAGLTALDRAKAISAELFSISRPPAVRTATDQTNYLFAWAENAQGDVVLMGIANQNIYVHPQNNVANLVGLFPELTPTEVAQLTGYINSVNSFEFQHILPSNTTFLTENEFNTLFPDGTI